MATATDSTGDLSWKSANNGLTVSCWFKISVPSNVTITDNMVILVNNRTGTAASPFSYLIQFDAFTGNVEFWANNTPLGNLVVRPYLDRWYHVAVVRSGTSYTGYLDGRQVFSVNQDVGNTANTDGLSIGGWSSAKYLYGEVQEVAIYQTALSAEVLTSLMLIDQDPTQIPQLRGYYKLAYSTNSSDSLKNSATTPAVGTDPLVKQGTGALTFEESNTGGEQSTFDSRKNGGRDALSQLSGAYSWQQSVLARPTVGVPLEIKIGYSSGNSFNSQALGSFDPFASSVLGSGWRNTFDARVIPSQYFSPQAGNDSLGLMLWDGSMEVWDFDYTVLKYLPRHAEYRGELALSDPVTCTWTTPDRLVYKFFRPDAGSVILRGRLKEIDDMNGNKLTVTWNTTFGTVAKVTDTAGTDWIFSYNAQSLLSTITGLGWTITFTYDASNRLASKSIIGPVAYASTPALNTRWQFFYDATSGLLSRVVDPRGDNDVQIAYDKYGRKINVTDSLGRTAQTDYNLTAVRQVTSTDAAGKKWVNSFDRRNHLLTRVDPLGNTFTNEFDANGNTTKTTDELGRITQFTYDARANTLTKTDALGQVWLWEYKHILNNGIAWNKPTRDLRPATAEAPTGWENRYTFDLVTGNLLRQDDVIGTLVTYTYFPSGLVQTGKDANNHSVSNTYTPEGFVLSHADAANQTTTYSRTELGWAATETNPLSQTTSYNYNLNGQVVQVTDALNRIVKKSYDPNGNLIGETDAKNQTTTYGYDSEDQRTSTTDRAGNTWSYTFNSRGLPETTSDPSLPNGSSPTVTKLYDDAGRLIKETDALGHFVTYQYDAVGNRTALVDKLGQTWSKTYDVLNRVLTDHDPLGNTATTTYDAAGRVSTATSPRGYVQRNEYDGRGRLSKWTDPAGSRWIYTYDGVGNILDIQDALNGHYIMAYGPRNERLTEQNQDGKIWTYTYDQLLRLKTQNDPNGVMRTLTYDAGSRVSAVAFSTGRSHSFIYDPNNNPLSITRTVAGVPTPTGLTFDAMDRVTTSTDAFSQVVGYSYDPVGRIQTLTYPGNKTLTRGYDAVGRLTLITDWAARTSTFGYDNADRMISRSYPNGITEALAYDVSGRINSLQYNQGGNATIALSYAYDANGSKTSSSELGLMNWSAPVAYNEAASFTAAGRLTHRIDGADPTHAKDFTYRYDSNGNMIQATSGLRSYLLSYDEDNRALTLDLQQSLQSHTIANAYDALGRRISRVLDGLETRYVLDLEGGMERILCDTDSSGKILARYIHAADLCYKEDARTGVLTCYLADAQTNVVRTTDSSGAITAEYAYSPYGRSLGVNGSSADPFRFVGSQGVMEDLPDIHFMRARYYSAEAGVFLSTDPLKRIGPYWRPDAYSYAASNPLAYNDPNGKIVPILAAIGAYYVGEQTVGRVANDYLGLVDDATAKWAHTKGDEELAADITIEGAGAEIDELPFVGPAKDFGVGLTYLGLGKGGGKLTEAGIGVLPLGQTYLGAVKLFDIAANVRIGVANTWQSVNSALSGNSNATGRLDAGVNSNGTNRPIQSVASAVKSSYSSGGGSAGGSTIVIRAGDTLSRIASAYGTTVQSLLAANSQIHNANLIYAGSTISIPSSSSGGGSSTKGSSSTVAKKK